MLFDLRGRGRRRIVQVMAFLFAFGFLAFGVGVGSGGGGVFNFLSENNGSGGTSFASEISKQKSILKKHPQDTAAWEKLIKAQLHESGGEAFVSSTGGITSKGKALFAEIAKSWSSYLAVNPSKPRPELAKEMLTVFSEEGLKEPSQEVQVLQIVVASDPTNFAYYAALAEYAYKAKNTRIGDLASEKAVSLAPKAERKKLKEELEAIKKNPTGASTASSAAASASGSTVTTGASTSISTTTASKSTSTATKATKHKSSKK